MNGGYVMRHIAIAMLATTALFAGLAQSASAADMRVPYRPPAPPPTPVYFSWTGCYVGGVQGGCDYQFAGGWVIGVAGDYAWTDASGSHFSPLFPGAVNHTKVDSLASVTGRIGYAWDRFLGYAKGGGAWARDKYDFIDGVLIGRLDD